MARNSEVQKTNLMKIEHKHISQRMGKNERTLEIGKNGKDRTWRNYSTWGWAKNLVRHTSQFNSRNTMRQTSTSQFVPHFMSFLEMYTWCIQWSSNSKSFSKYIFNVLRRNLWEIWNMYPKKSMLQSLPSTQDGFGKMQPNNSTQGHVGIVVLLGCLYAHKSHISHIWIRIYKDIGLFTATYIHTCIHIGVQPQ